MIEVDVLRAPNRKGLDGYGYNEFEYVFVDKGEAHCALGISPQEVMDYVFHTKPSLYERVRRGRGWGRGEGPRKNIAQTLSQYSNLNDHLPSYGRRPYLKLSSFRAPLLFTLKPEIWAEYARHHAEMADGERRAKASQAARVRREKLKIYIAAWEGAEIQRLNTERERGAIGQAFKKQLSHYRCEVCEFDFEAIYGREAKGFIEAHHKDPLSSGARQTTIADFNAVCSNCHSMLHWKGLRTAEQLKRVVDTLRAKMKPD